MRHATGRLARSQSAATASSLSRRSDGRIRAIILRLRVLRTRTSLCLELRQPFLQHCILLREALHLLVLALQLAHIQTSRLDRRRLGVVALDLGGFLVVCFAVCTAVAVAIACFRAVVAAACAVNFAFGWEEGLHFFEGFVDAIAAALFGDFVRGALGS